jgi:hypothetical protein
MDYRRAAPFPLEAMSDTILNFIPIDPSFVPDESRRQAAYKAACATFPEAQVERSTTPDVCFVDPGLCYPVLLVRDVPECLTIRVDGGICQISFSGSKSAIRPQ